MVAPFQRLLAILLAAGGALCVPEHSCAFFNTPPQLTLPQAMKLYKPTRDAVAAIMTRYPPTEYLYVGVGRSPTLFIALMKATLGDSAAINIPLSDMGNFKPGAYSQGVSSSSFGENPKPIDYERLTARLRKHLDHYFPTPAEIAGKKVLLVDFASSGQGIVNTRREIAAYFVARDGAKSSQVSAIAIPEGKESIKVLKANDIDILEVSGALRDKLIKAQFEGLAEYPEFMATIESRNAENERPPAKRTRATIVSEKLEWDKNSIYAGTDKDRWVRKVKAARKKYIENLRGFEDLTAAFETRAAQDLSFARFLAKRSPESPFVKQLKRDPNSPFFDLRALRDFGTCVLRWMRSPI
jgi:hypothetical protein